MNATPFKAGIVGLGQVALLFDEDDKRSGVWTHFTAYERLKQVDLVAVCDPDQTRLDKALRRKPDLHVYSDLSQMLISEKLDCLSICTPTPLHLEHMKLASFHVKVMLCEKPMGESMEEARKTLNLCEVKGVRVGVNYHRRFQGHAPQVKTLLNRGALGELHWANMMYAGPLDAVGSHAVDLLSHCVGPLEFKDAYWRDENHVSASFYMGERGITHVEGTAPRENFVMELDVLGSEGRLRLLNDAENLEFYEFRPSHRYGGYRELYPKKMHFNPPLERFMPVFTEMMQILEGKQKQFTSSGEAALATHRILHSMKANHVLASK